LKSSVKTELGLYYNQTILRCFVSILLKNHVIRQSKTPHKELGRQAMKIQEASEDITSWENSVPSSKTSLEEEHTQKDEEKGKNTLKAETTRPNVLSHTLGVQNSVGKHNFQHACA